MSNRRIQIGVFLVGLFLAAFPPPAHAVWNVGGQFKVGGQLRAITPTATTFPDNSPIVDPTCGAQGGTSLAIAQGSKLAAAHGVDPSANPIVLVVSCLDNNDTTKRAQLYFLNPANGNVVKSIQTNTTASPTLPFAPNNGWAHLVLRPDQGDLLGCGNDGTIYRIDFSQFNSIADGTATSVNRPSGLPTNCAALAWDPEERKIYQGVTGGNNTVGVHVFQDTSSPTAIPADAFFNLPSCTPSGIAITGGLVLVACKTTSTILRLDKGDPQVGRVGGTILGVNGTLGVLGLPAGSNLNPGLGDLACDPVTFNRDPVTFNPRDTFTDGLWSRLGTNGNGVVALEFPAFTCGLPSKSVVVDATFGLLSPLAPGLSAPAAGQAGAIPLAACFDTSGKVVDSDGDGLPDCWETSGINFAGDGNSSNVFSLCVQGDTNADGVPACASPSHKDLFVEVNWMVNHKPDPLALSQTQAATSVGVQSVRGAFVAAPVSNQDATAGIRIHFQVKPSSVTLTSLESGATPTQKEVSELVFTPCTPPAQNPDGTPNVKSLSDAADFDAIKKQNFGAELQPNQSLVNAKRLAFRYVLFAHNQTGAGGAGSSASGCSELGGDDAAVTLASFTTTTVSSCTSPDCTQATHNRGSTDQQAGTFMHEFGHTLGLRHGGGDNINCKPNYLSVMSYTRQIAGSPIPGRRLDYSRAELPNIGLNEGSLLENATPVALCPLCTSATLGTLGVLSPFFPTADQTAFGPTAWSVVAANSATINWNKDKTNKGVAIIETSPVSSNVNQGSSGGCDGSGIALTGHDDWGTLLYRASAALDFAGGVHSATKQEHTSLTKENATALFLAADLDVNGVGDAQDCGTAPAGPTTTLQVDSTSTSVPIGVDPTTLGFSPTGGAFLGSTTPLDEFTYTGTDSVGFTGVTGIETIWPIGTTVWATLLCPAQQVSLGPPPEPTCVAPDGTRSFCPTHRIDIKPSSPADSTGAKTISLGTEATVTIAIFAEANPTTKFPILGNGLWDPTTELVTTCPQPPTSDCLTFSVESVSLPVKINKNGQGTCSARDVADPITGRKDGFKDMLCQFSTTGLPLGRHEGIVSGFFIDPVTGLETAFRARQDFIVVK